jgi:hypothetical protein
VTRARSPGLSTLTYGGLDFLMQSSAVARRHRPVPAIPLHGPRVQRPSRQVSFAVVDTYSNRQIDRRSRPRITAASPAAVPIGRRNHQSVVGRQTVCESGNCPTGQAAHRVGRWTHPGPRTRRARTRATNPSGQWQPRRWRLHQLPRSFARMLPTLPDPFAELGERESAATSKMAPGTTTKPSEASLNAAHSMCVSSESVSNAKQDADCLAHDAERRHAIRRFRFLRPLIKIEGYEWPVIKGVSGANIKTQKSDNLFKCTVRSIYSSL